MNLQSDLYLNKPQLEVAIDRDRASDLGVSVRDIGTTLQILLGGLDISTFKLEGETYDVIAQLRREVRARPQDLLGLFGGAKSRKVRWSSALLWAKRLLITGAVIGFCPLLGAC